MIDQIEAEQLMTQFISLRNKYKETNDKKDKIELELFEKKCIKKFMYLVTSRTARYKQFSNYEDLNQEGLGALVKAMSNYKLGMSFHWWAHKYIDTKIARSANLHTTIRYPLKIAKAMRPHRESILPVVVEHRYCPDLQLENCQTTSAIRNVVDELTDDQKKIVEMAFGFDGNKPTPISKICKIMNISRTNCLKEIESAQKIMREKIKM